VHAERAAGRPGPITTHVVPAADKPHYLARTWERLREEVAGGGQAYVVCPRIGAEEGAGGADGSGPEEGAGAGAAGRDDDTDGGYEVPEEDAGRPSRAVLDVAAELAEGPLAGLRMRILHGRMPADDKDAAMRAFADGSVDVLVATTVVEVGVDVPNATIMVIMDADRFGVSQLHQLRGRVGRGGKPGCACWSRTRRRAARRVTGWMRSPPRWTGSRCPGSTWSSAARGTCWAPRRRAASPG